MKFRLRLLAVASAAFFIASSALAQNVGTVSNHAVAVGKGAGKQGLTSVVPSATAGTPLVSQGSSADPSFADLTRLGTVTTGVWNGTTIAAAFGGTGQSTFVIGDLLQANSTSTLARLAAVATGNVLISGGVGTVSSWGKVGLTTHVSGVLGLANGGTASDLSATGGTSQFLRQNTTGGAITPVRPACADLSNSTSYCSAAVGQLAGTTTNDSASAGNIGEYVSSNVVSGSAVSLTTNTPVNLTSVSLTAGDWDIWGHVLFTAGATTNITVLAGSLSTTSATLNTAPTNYSQFTYPGSVIGAVNTMVPDVRTRVSVNSTTTIYLVAQATFTVSTLSTWGSLQARRVR